MATSSNSGVWFLSPEAVTRTVPQPRSPAADDLPRLSAAHSQLSRAAASLRHDDDGRRVRLQHHEQCGALAGAAIVTPVAEGGGGGSGGGQGLRGRLLHLDLQGRLRHKTDPGL